MTGHSYLKHKAFEKFLACTDLYVVLILYIYFVGQCRYFCELLYLNDAKLLTICNGFCMIVILTLGRVCQHYVICNKCTNESGVGVNTSTKKRSNSRLCSMSQKYKYIFVVLIIART